MSQGLFPFRDQGYHEAPRLPHLGHRVESRPNDGRIATEWEPGPLDGFRLPDHNDFYRQRDPEPVNPIYHDVYRRGLPDRPGSSFFEPPLQTFTPDSSLYGGRQQFYPSPATQPPGYPSSAPQHPTFVRPSPAPQHTQFGRPSPASSHCSRTAVEFPQPSDPRDFSRNIASFPPLQEARYTSHASVNRFFDAAPRLSRDNVLDPRSPDLFPQQLTPATSTGGESPEAQAAARQYAEPRSSSSRSITSSEIRSSSPTARLESRRQDPFPQSRVSLAPFSQISSPMQASQASPMQPSSMKPANMQSSCMRQSPMQATLTRQPRPSVLELPHAPPIAHGIQLISPRQALPDNLRAVFPFDLFNAIQSKCFPAIYQSQDNIVVSAPTGSGKTVLMELGICKLGSQPGNANAKIVYMAPTKALCSERARDWEKKFQHLGLQCAALTGDTSQSEMKRVSTASIIVTTPEKWDSITRKWQDHRKLLRLVELFLIDEVHILKDARGATLEAVVSRMKTIGSSVRFIALSATVPNSDDIASWLGLNHAQPYMPARRETFGEELRPVKLHKIVQGYECNGNDYVFDTFLTGKIPTLLSKHSKRKPVLVFCFTKKSCETTASALAECGSMLPANEKIWPIPSRRIPVISPELQELVKWGVAFHHAGLDPQDRNAVEQAFLNGELGVICCTSTLAVGVNLPCHTVVMKNTVGWTEHRTHELSDLEVMQMLGRAGRPQFDSSATAIILTRAANKQRYERMVSGQEILESTLHLNLIEHLNSEVVLGTIKDLASAKKWLGGTFLSVRLRKNPDHYKLAKDMDMFGFHQVEEQLEEICHRNLGLLQRAQLVETKTEFRSTDYGRSMSKYMVEFKTMEMLLKIPRAVGMEELITTLSRATEFNEFRLKQSEPAIFREMNKSPLILYPIKEKIVFTWHKISLIVQIALGGAAYPNTPAANKLNRQLASDKTMIFDKLNRLVRCVVDCKGCEKDGVGTRTALELARAVSAGAWEGRPSQLLQIPGIGPAGMMKLVSQDVRTVLDLASRDYGDIERLMTRRPPFGKKTSDELSKFPRLALDASISGHRKIKSSAGFGTVIVDVKATLRCTNEGDLGWNKRTPIFTFFAETTVGQDLVYFWRGCMNKKSRDGIEVGFPAPLSSFKDQVICHFTAEEIVGTIVSKKLRHNVPEAEFPKHPPRASQNASTSLTRSDTNVGGGTRAMPRKTVIQLDSDGELDNDLDDDDLICAAEKATKKALVEGSQRKSGISSQSRVEELSDYDLDVFDDFHAIDHISGPRRDSGMTQDTDEEDYSGDHSEAKLRRASRAVDAQPVRLPNGNWKCGHRCSGGALTKGGKPCSHRCCVEGTTKPPKKGKADSQETKVENAKRTKFQVDDAPLSGKKKPGKKRQHDWEVQGTNEHEAESEGVDHAGAGPARKKSKVMQTTIPWRPKTAQHTPQTLQYEFSDSDVEVIDLTNADDETDQYQSDDDLLSSIEPTPTKASAEKKRKEDDLVDKEEDRKMSRETDHSSEKAAERDHDWELFDDSPFSMSFDLDAKSDDRVKALVHPQGKATEPRSVNKDRSATQHRTEDDDPFHDIFTSEGDRESSTWPEPSTWPESSGSALFDTNSPAESSGPDGGLSDELESVYNPGDQDLVTQNTRDKAEGEAVGKSEPCWVASLDNEDNEVVAFFRQIGAKWVAGPGS